MAYPTIQEQEITIPAGAIELKASLTQADAVQGVVVFAHGSGGSRTSPRHRAVANHLQEAGLATLLVDLFSAAEECSDAQNGRLRFAIPLLTGRLVAAIDWLGGQPQLGQKPVGLFGASTGAAAALSAAALRSRSVRAVVCPGGRPDLAPGALSLVRCPVLMIVGGRDRFVLQRNRDAASQLLAPQALEVVRGASHLFEEPGSLEEVANLSRTWFLRHLGRH